MYEVQAELFPEQCVSRAVLGQGAVQDQDWGAVGWDKWLHLLLMESENYLGRKKNAASELKFLCRNYLFYSPFVTGKPLRTGLGRVCPNCCEREVFRATNLKFFLPSI